MANGRLLLFYIFITFIFLLNEINCFNKVIDMLCPRIFFSTPEWSKFPYKGTLESVYIKDNTRSIDGFPVYRKERGGIYLIYSRNYFYFVRDINRYYSYDIRIKARSSYLDYPSFQSSWIRSINNKTDALGAIMVRSMLQYDKGFGNKDWSNLMTVKVVCVGFSQCQSGKLLYGVPGVLPPIDYQTDVLVKEDYFNEKRPVYRFIPPSGNEKSKNIKLYHAKGFWMIGNEYPSTRGHYAVQSSALRPEYISETWEKASWGSWVEVNSTIHCVRGRSVSCSECQNGATCRTISKDNNFCICPIGWTGKFCESRSQTCNKEPFPNVDNEIGAMASRICRGFLGDASEATSLCLKDGWENWGFYCRDKVTPRPPPPTPMNFDKLLDGNINIYVYCILPVFILFYPCVFHGFGGCKCGTKSWWKLYSIHYYVGTFLWIIYLIVYYVIELRQYGDVFKDISIFAWVCAPLMYIYVLIESACSKESEYLRGSEEGESNLKNHIQGIISESPVISIQGECYHYETRTRTVSYTDSNGNLQTRIETYQEKVVTWSGSETFSYKSWVDFTDVKQFDVLETVEKAQRIDFYKSYRCADSETREALDKFEEDFDDAHRHLDVNYYSYVTLYIDGFKEHVLFKDENAPCCLNCCGFCMFTLFCLSWPYRIWLKSSTGKLEFSFKKLISINNTMSSEALQRAKDTETETAFSQRNSENSSAPSVTCLPPQSGEIIPVHTQQPYQGHINPAFSSTAPPPGSPYPVQSATSSNNHAYQPGPNYSIPGAVGTVYPEAPPSYEDALRSPPIELKNI